MTSPTLLITRPEPQASHTAAHYASKGWQCILSPAIVTTPHIDAHTRIAGLAECCDAWIITSSVALGLLENYYKTIGEGHSNAGGNPLVAPDYTEQWIPACAGVTLPLYVTGEVLAARAKQAGFHNVQHGGGSAQGVLDWLRTHGDPTLYYGYLHSNHQTMPLVEELQKMGWHAAGTEIYQSHPAPCLTPEAQTALTQKHVQAVSFYSTMTLRVFLTLTAQAGLQHCLVHVEAWCYSKAITRAIPAGLFAAIKPIDIASSP